MNRMQRKPTAVLLSSDAVGLGAVRSLHLGNVPTTVVMLDPWEPVRASRYGHKILVPQSADRDGAILDVLSRIEADPPANAGDALPLLYSVGCRHQYGARQGQGHRAAGGQPDSLPAHCADAAILPRRTRAGA